MATTPDAAPVGVPERGRLERPAPGAARRASPPLPWLKPGIFLGGLVPLASIVMRGAQGALGADPIAKVENELGLAAHPRLVLPRRGDQADAEAVAALVAE